MANPAGVLAFLRVVGNLKHLKRTGWVQKGVTGPEDVSGHMYRMAVMSMLLPAGPGADLDREKVIKMSLVHDLAEAVVGDITPHCGISGEEKFRMEKEGLIQITSTIDRTTADEIYSLWQEYEDQTTPESRMVKDFDKFDMILQAHEYEGSEGKPGFLQDFFDSTRGKFTTPLVKSWVETLETERQEVSTDESGATAADATTTNNK